LPAFRDGTTGLCIDLGPDRFEKHGAATALRRGFGQPSLIDLDL
jgi:hypothetical protein